MPAHIDFIAHFDCIRYKKRKLYTEMTQVFSGMIFEREIMGSRGLVPLQGVLKGGGAAPFFLVCKQF